MTIADARAHLICMQCINQQWKRKDWQRVCTHGVAQTITSTSHFVHFYAINGSKLDSWPENFSSFFPCSFFLLLPPITYTVIVFVCYIVVHWNAAVFPNCIEPLATAATAAATSSAFTRHAFSCQCFWMRETCRRYKMLDNVHSFCIYICIRFSFRKTAIFSHYLSLARLFFLFFFFRDNSFDTRCMWLFMENGPTLQYRPIRNNLNLHKKRKKKMIAAQNIFEATNGYYLSA